MHIAVIGGGVSGLSAAYLLSQSHDVALFESDERLGGHAHTHVISTAHGTVPVDTGFMVYNPAQYPELVGLLSSLGVQTAPTDMSFSVTIADQVSYSSRFTPFGLFAEPRALGSLTFWNFLRSIVRFHALGKKTLRDGTHEETPLGDFLKLHRLNGHLQEWYLFPMLSSIWSASISDIRRFPTGPTLRFMKSHDLLNNVFRAKWRTIQGGSRVYVDALASVLRERGVTIKTSATVTRVERREDAVVVTSARGTEQFDQVVFATPADTTLALLHEPSEAEHDILGMFSYSTNSMALHRDTSVLPRAVLSRAAWNYRAHRLSHDHDGPVAITYDMHLLQNTPARESVLVTLNGDSAVDPHLVYARAVYRHPRYSLDSVTAQRRLGEIQGKNRTLFTGAHWGFGFHEDGVVSAVNAVRLLGVTPPWKHISRPHS